MLFTITFPVGNQLIVDQHIGPDHLGTIAPQAFHQKRVAGTIYIGYDAENSLLGIYGANSTILGKPHLGQVITDKIGAYHGRGGFATARRRRTGEICFPTIRSGHTSDEHMFAEFFSSLIISGIIDCKTVIAFFHKQSITSIGTEG